MSESSSKASRAAVAIITGLALAAACWFVVAGGRSCRRSAPPPVPPATRAATKPTTQPEDELDRLLAKIDMAVYKQCRQDLRDWLDQRVRQQIGGILPDAWHVTYRADAAYVKMARGAVADMAAQLFRAYEVLGDDASGRAYRDAALKTCEFLLKAQQPKGYWLTAYVATRSGKVGVQASRRICRIGDGCQFRPFALMLYAYKLTGERKYLDAAERSADCLLSLHSDATGSWPDFWDFTKSATQGAPTDTMGVRLGGSYKGFATTDPMRMMVMMYHATGHRKYLAPLPRIGQWIFDTQLGRGGVRGWCPQYLPPNRPRRARETEPPVITPQVFNRCTGPMLGWLYGMTGRPRYLALLREAHAWMQSVEKPGGWAQSYLPDGTAVFRLDRRLWRCDDPKAPKDVPGVGYSRDAVQLDDVKTVLDVIAASGRKGLVRWHAGAKVLSPEQYRQARLAAARRATDAARLHQVRRRWMRQDAPDLPKKDWLGRGGVDRQAWHSIHTWREPYHPPPGLSQWQYVYDVRLARGEISADAAAAGGRGLEAMHLYEPWDVMGDWTQRAVEVESWLDLPLDEAPPRRRPTPAAPAGRPGLTPAVENPFSSPESWCSVNIECSGGTFKRSPEGTELVGDPAVAEAHPQATLPRLLEGATPHRLSTSSMCTLHQPRPEGRGGRPGV